MSVGVEPGREVCDERDEDSTIDVTGSDAASAGVVIDGESSEAALDVEKTTWGVVSAVVDAAVVVVVVAVVVVVVVVVG